MKALTIIFFLFTSIICAQNYDPIPAKNLNFTSLISHIYDDGQKTEYGIVGYDDIWGPKERYQPVIAEWLKNNPEAVFTPVSYVYMKTKKGNPIIMYYGWITNGNKNLGIHLVETGIMRANAMTRFKTLDEYSEEEKTKYKVSTMSNEPKIKTLIEDSIYNKYLEKLMAAEERAKSKKIGVWSDD
ncbi:MAG: hypothetical protein ABJM06_09180 [Gilvibacter sp.]